MDREERKGGGESKAPKTSQSVVGHSFGIFALGKSKLMINHGTDRLLSILYTEV